MSKMIKNKTVKSLLDDLSSKSPTPGGGVVAALAGQFAASLVQMVCNLTYGKKGYEKVENDLMKYQKRVSEIEKRLERLANDDAKAYEKVMQAFKIDKSDKERTKEIKKALIYATDVPLEVRKLSQELEKIAVKVGKIGNKNAASDAKTAFHLAQAAAKSALENVKINKEALKKIKG